MPFHASTPTAGSAHAIQPITCKTCRLSSGCSQRTGSTVECRIHRRKPEKLVVTGVKRSHRTDAEPTSTSNPCHHYRKSKPEAFRNSHRANYLTTTNVRLWRLCRIISRRRRPPLRGNSVSFYESFQVSLLTSACGCLVRLGLSRHQAERPTTDQTGQHNLTGPENGRPGHRPSLVTGQAVARDAEAQIGAEARFCRQYGFTFLSK